MLFKVFQSALKMRNIILKQNRLYKVCNIYNILISYDCITVASIYEECNLIACCKNAIKIYIINVIVSGTWPEMLKREVENRYAIL